MFEDNWFLFLLIIMAVFNMDGTFSEREIAVMMSILFALTMTNNTCTGSTNTMFNRT